MKKKSAEAPTDALSQDELLWRKIGAAKAERAKLQVIAEQNPSEENRLKLIQIEEIIERDSDTLHLAKIAEVSTDFETLANFLPAIVESQDEEELLRLGDEADAAKILQTLRALRNRMFDSTMIISANQTVADFLHRIDKTVSQGEEKLAEKRAAAAAHFPELARKFRRPDYEMPAVYTEMLEFVLKQIERRDEIVKNLKNVSPQKRKETVKLLSEIDKVISRAEQKLADTYEKHQKNRQYLEGLRKMLANASETERYQMREYIKTNPGAMPSEVEKMMQEEFPDQETD